MNTLQETELILISHKLCPYVQKAVAVLEETGTNYKRIDIELNNKPAWFQEISPLGKVPVLVVDDDVVLFESTVISEYINDISGENLLADEALERAHQRAWVEFSAASINNIARIYNAVSEQQFTKEKIAFQRRLPLLEESLPADGFFAGAKFSLVDAAFAPIFRYLDLFEELTDFQILKNYPKIQQWQQLLMEHSSIKKSARADYPNLLLQFIAGRNSYLGERAWLVQSNNMEQIVMLGGN